MEAARKWIFSDEELKGTPNKMDGLSRGEEMNNRYRSALMIQELGDKLNLNQLCINTGIVYMHRFYTKRAFSKFPYKTMSAACLFLAAKIEDQHRKVEHVAKTALYQICKDTAISTENRQKGIQDMMEEIYDNEQILLGTLGFETMVEHPHSLILMTTSIMKASKEVSHSSYLLASASLFTTMMCIQYPSTIVACACIMTAWKWAGLEMQAPEDGKEWFKKVDSNITQEKLQALSNELSASINTYQTKFFKKKSHKPSTKDGHIELINRPSSSSTHVTPIHHSQRRMAASSASTQEHQNGNASVKNCDNKPTATPSSADVRKMKPAMRTFEHTDSSNRSAHDSQKLHQAEIPARMPSSTPAFTMPHPPEVKSKIDKSHSLPTQYDIKKSKVEHQSWPSISHSLPVNSMSKLEVSHKHHINYSQMSQTADNKLSRPSENASFAVPYHVDQKPDELAKDKMLKDHKKEKSKYSEDNEYKEKHRKKSKHNRDYKEEHSKKVLPVKIKLPPGTQPPVLSPHFEEFKLKIKEIPRPDEKMDAANQEPYKERLTMKIGKDVHGNFYQQKQFNPNSGHDNPSELSIEHFSRKRRPEQQSSTTSSKKARHDRGKHEDGHFNSVFPPLPTDLPPLPPQF